MVLMKMKIIMMQELNQKKLLVKRLNSGVEMPGTLFPHDSFAFLQSIVIWLYLNVTLI